MAQVELCLGIGTGCSTCTAVYEILSISAGDKRSVIVLSQVPVMSDIHKEVLRYVQYLLHCRVRHGVCLKGAKGEGSEGVVILSRVVGETSRSLMGKSGSET